MTLQEIRQSKSFDELKPSIVFLCDNMQYMTFGDFQAYKRTIESVCICLGYTYKDVNNYAENYQNYGQK